MTNAKAYTYLKGIRDCLQQSIRNAERAAPPNELTFEMKLYRHKDPLDDNVKCGVSDRTLCNPETHPDHFTGLTVITHPMLESLYYMLEWIDQDVKRLKELLLGESSAP